MCKVLKSPGAPRNEKRIALRFVGQLVGDIHQRLHAGVSEIAARIHQSPGRADRALL